MFLGVSAQEWAHLVVKITFLGIISYASSNYIFELLHSRDKKTRENVKKILKTVDIDENIDLNEYEIDIATQVIDPASIKVDFSEIGGLDDVINVIRTDIISLIENPSIMGKSAYIRLPKGVLLYGPPGCGKTMIAQAAAKECNARFINLNISTLTSKWYGESIKLADAVFSLAHKISPCIIFIDELDTFLRSRSMNDHEATIMMKAVFLQKWDGFANNSKNKIIVMGASNRKFNIDEAILSRMEMQFEIKLPDLIQRKKILKNMFKSMDVSNNVDLDELASLTNGFSGRDLDDVCRNASMIALREYFKLNNRIQMQCPREEGSIRKISNIDFRTAIQNKKKDFNIILD